MNEQFRCWKETTSLSEPIPYTIKAPAVELKFETIRLLDHTGSDSIMSDATELFPEVLTRVRSLLGTEGLQLLVMSGKLKMFP